MFSRNRRFIPRAWLVLAFCLVLPLWISGQEIFIYRPYLEKDAAARLGKIVLHGDLFAQLQNPSTYPSFNDLSGAPDRWNYGFHDVIFLTESTRLMAQLVAHDDTANRTKFDWHFSLRQSLTDYLELIVGHDSNHDSDHVSYSLEGRPFFTNRNYIGFGFPIERESFYIEPYTWFFHHSNQRTHLDLSGGRIVQEFGLRAGAVFAEKVTLSFQIYSRTENYFYLGQDFALDVIVRFAVADWLALTMGTSLWTDLEVSPLGNRLKFSKWIWGLAIPF